MTLDDIIKVVVSFGGGAIVLEAYKRFNGKRKENADTRKVYLEGDEMGMKLSEYFNQTVEKKVVEKTQELRNYIAESELKHYNEKVEQGKIFASKFSEMQHDYDRKINVLRMTIEALTLKYETHMSKVEGKLQDEIRLRTACMEKLDTISKRIESIQ